MLRGDYLTARGMAAWRPTWPHWYYGWTVVGVSMLTLAVAWGTRAAYGVLLPALVDAFGWGRGLTAGPLALGALLGAGSAPLWGALLDRYGPRRVWAAAATLSGAGLVVAANTREPWQLYLGVGVLLGSALTPFFPNSQGVVVAPWFPRRRGLAIGIMATGIGLGVLGLAPLSQWTLSQAGWETAFVVQGVLSLAVVGPLNAVLQRRRPADDAPLLDGRQQPAPHGREATASAAAPARAGGPTLHAALRQRRYWAFALGTGCGVVPAHLLLVHGSARFVDLGFSPAAAAHALGLSGAVAMIGMLLWGAVADRHGAEWANTAGSAALMASIGLLFVLTPDHAWLLLLYAVLLGLGLSARIGGLTSFTGAALCQGRAFGTLMGIVSTVIALGTALGPALGGWVFDATGSYDLAFVVGLACAVMSVAGIWLAAPRRGLLAASATSAPAIAHGAVGSAR